MYNGYIEAASLVYIYCIIYVGSKTIFFHVIVVTFYSSLTENFEHLI